MQPLEINSRVNDERIKKFADALAKDKAERGFRPDIHVLGSHIDREQGRIWLILSFSVNVGPPSTKDILGLVYKFYPDFEIDWKKSYGVKNGSLYIAIKPFVERIPIRDMNDIPSGFSPKGTGIYSFKEEDGTESYWQLIKEGDKFFLTRKDGTKPPSVISPVEIHQKEGLKVGTLVKTANGEIGVIQDIKDGNYIVKLLGQTKMVELKDVAEFDPEREKELLKAYYSNIYPPDFVEALLR